MTILQLTWTVLWIWGKSVQILEISTQDWEDDYHRFEVAKKSLTRIRTIVFLGDSPVLWDLDWCEQQVVQRHCATTLQVICSVLYCCLSMRRAGSTSTTLFSVVDRFARKRWQDRKVLYATRKNQQACIRPMKITNLWMPSLHYILCLFLCCGASFFENRSKWLLEHKSLRLKVIRCGSHQSFAMW